MAAAFTVRGVRVPPNSATLEEARSRVKNLFKSACRSLPAVMEIYNLHDVATISQLRSAIAAQIRKNANITNPKSLWNKEILVGCCSHWSSKLGQWEGYVRSIEDDALGGPQEEESPQFDS